MYEYAPTIQSLWPAVKGLPYHLPAARRLGPASDAPLALQNSSPNIPNTSRRTLQWTSCLMMAVSNTTFAHVRLLSSPQSSDQPAGC
jgi:hypothetical protein